MAPKFIYTVILMLIGFSVPAQEKLVPITTDSIIIRVKPSYDSVSTLHRYFFGENFRKEYSADTRVPVLRISEIAGGLKATSRGGGHQSYSLRLVDKTGKEWVLRSVEKYPEVLLPEQFRKTFAKDVIKDNMSAQHPFSALVVPIIAAAIDVPHTNPIIGWVSPDPGLGEFADVFANTLCLLEEREPLGNSDNSSNMLKKLTDDNDNTYDAAMMLRAKALDVILGDWDRHEDQWRWRPEKISNGVKYLPIPRDRDQVFYNTDGVLQRVIQSTWLLPFLQGFERNIKDINWYMWEGRKLNSRLTAELDEQQWDVIIKGVCANLTDEVFEEALGRLPEPSYSLRHDQLFQQLKIRRETLPKMMNEYYHFLNEVVDLEVSDKSELVRITDTPDGGLDVDIYKRSKQRNSTAPFFKKKYTPAITKEIRLYLHDGDDSLVLNNRSSQIKVRIISGKGEKVFDIENSGGRAILYGKKKDTVYIGADASQLVKKLSKDTSNVRFIPKDQYSRHFTRLNAGYNVDDGVQLGFIYRSKSPGFRKEPHGNTQFFSVLFGPKNSALKFNYKGEWMDVIGRTDVVVAASALAPNNTQNFFGAGNETIFTEILQDVRFYRTRFSTYQLDPSLRWNVRNTTITAGPSLQFYRFDPSFNNGRFISTSMLHTADSLTVSKSKGFAGLKINLLRDTRDNSVIASSGSFATLVWNSYKGLNNFSNSFSQATGSLSLYKTLGPGGNMVLANRIAGGVTFGKTAFYQQQFLGGEDNLLGYRQFRFAGDHVFYNNLELRLKISDFVTYLLPGQLGVLGFYDVGRVWRKNEKSEIWHHGAGGGIYLAPASMAVFRFVMGRSSEGWYPYAAFNFRF